MPLQPSTRLHATEPLEPRLRCLPAPQRSVDGKQPQNNPRKSGLSRFPNPGETTAKEVQSVCRLVCSEYGFTLAQLMSRARPQPLAWARHVAYFLARFVTEESYPILGRLFDGRDHSTILSGIRQVENQRDIGSRDWQRVERIMQKLLVDG